MFKRKIPNQKYYASRGNELRAKRALGNKLLIIKNLVIRMSVVFLFGGIFYVIFFTPVLAIKNVVVEGNKVISSGDIEGIVMSAAGQKKWKIFSSNFLLLSLPDTEKKILDRFGNIDTVRVERKFPDTVKVTVKEKPADIAWCNKIRIEKVKNEKKVPGDEIPAYEIPQCYLSDENGLIYEKIGDSVPDGSIKVFRDEPIEMGSKISDENLKNFIRKIFYSFGNKTGLDLAYLYILPSAERELHLVTNKNLKIYFDLNRSADDQISDLGAFIKDDLKVNGAKSMDYEYIDLRIVDRINVKPKEEAK